MSKKGKRLREFERNNRVFNISDAQREREEKYGNRKGSRSQSMTAEVESSETFKRHGKKKNKITNVRRFVFSVIIVIFIASVGMSAFKIIQLKGERDLLLQKNAELIKLKEDMTEEMEHINSAEYMEQQARKELKLIKENEILFVVSDEEKTTE